MSIVFLFVYFGNNLVDILWCCIGKLKSWCVHCFGSIELSVWSYSGLALITELLEKLEHLQHGKQKPRSAQLRALEDLHPNSLLRSVLRGSHISSRVSALSNRASIIAILRVLCCPNGEEFIGPHLGVMLYASVCFESGTEPRAALGVVHAGE